MQHRQQIREQFGVLEEKLEELGVLAHTAVQNPERAVVGTDLLLQDALESVRELSRLVHDQQQLKSIPAQDFILRVCGLLAQDAAAKGVPIAISHFGEGKISMEMAELVMGAIVAAFRASLKSQQAMTRNQRIKNYLFPIGSIYIEVRATSGEIQFRLLDDGEGFGAASSAEDRRFSKLRESIANCGGWFGYRGLHPCGGVIEFKVPFAHNRTDAFVLRQGAFELLVPSACVADVVQRSARGPAEAYRLHETLALEPGGEGSPMFVRICVADVEFWVGCDSISESVRVRRQAAGDFVGADCWMRFLGVFQDEGVTRALPLLDGAALVKFQGRGGGHA